MKNDVEIKRIIPLRAARFFSVFRLHHADLLPEFTWDLRLFSPSRFFPVLWPLLTSCSSLLLRGFFPRVCKTSPGTHTFFHSLPAAFTMYNPCSYWALFCCANLPLHMALYAISVRQARALPIRRPFNS